MKIFASVNEREIDGICVSITFGWVVVIEWVGAILRNVVFGGANLREDSLDELFGEIGDGCCVYSEEELVEKGGGCAHDEAYVVVAADAGSVGGNAAVGEIGAKILEGSKAEDCRIKGPEFKRVEFVDCGVERYEELTRGAAVGYDDWELHVEQSERAVITEQ